jgi:hypothetical protein
MANGGAIRQVLYLFDYFLDYNLVGMSLENVLTVYQYFEYFTSSELSRDPTTFFEIGSYPFPTFWTALGRTYR